MRYCCSLQTCPGALRVNDLTLCILWIIPFCLKHDVLLYLSKGMLMFLCPSQLIFSHVGRFMSSLG